MEQITLTKPELESLVLQAAQKGAEIAISDFALFHYKDAAKKLGIHYNTLQARVREGKIKATDGRISGLELRKYLEKIPQKLRTTSLRD